MNAERKQPCESCRNTFVTWPDLAPGLVIVFLSGLFIGSLLNDTLHIWSQWRGR